MKIILSILFTLSMLVSYAQGEANIWYFGENAGLDFNSGSPVVLTNGQLVTDEGCATISNSSGQLLFYTDGITVWNKNHQIMVNGTGLKGHSSSTQSATIVAKPGSPNLYYIFTIAQFVNPDGFRYSIVDMNLDGGNGAITSDKNILIYSPTTEGIGVTQHTNGIDFWIVIHEWDSANFRAYQLTPTGLSTTPIVSNIGVVFSTYNTSSIGTIRISQSGTKIVYPSLVGSVQLFDFNSVTGILSNNVEILNGTGNFYGAAFSPDESLLYISNEAGKIFQFNLNAIDIAGSKITIHTGGASNFPGQLQVGIDNKVYVAINNSNYLGVINNPNVLGMGCNFQLNGFYLQGKKSRSGLPSFNQSFFFAPAIQFDNACLGQTTTLEFNTNQTVLSATWNFGDGTTSNLINPSHTYTAAGTYTVSVVVTTPNGTGTNTRDIIISAVPTATQPAAIKMCDTNNDGFAPFDLTQQNSSILNGQSATQYGIRYFANATDYASNTAIANSTSYTNATAFGQQTLVAEVYNVANSTCKATTNFTIQVFKTAVAPTLPLQAMRVCDNTSFGTNADGKVVFDLTQNQATILNGQTTAEFSVLYYADSGFVNQIISPTNYVNTNATETIYVKISTVANTNCFATTSFAIEVYGLPIVNATISLKQCDDNNDGFSAFNLTEANQLLVNSTTSLTFSYFETLAEAQNNSNQITNTISYINQTVSNDIVFVRVENTNNCFSVVPLNLLVSTTSIPASFQKTFSACDTAVSGSISDGISSFDFSSVTANVQALFPVPSKNRLTKN